MKSLLTLVAALCCTAAFAAEIPRALPPGTLPDDARLGPLKELDGYFPFTPSASREAWAQRAEQVRMQIRVALGLWPEPTKTPLNAVIHGRIEREDFTVEKVAFESMPGLFVTGTLYRPRTPGAHPAVLCPHGHWDEARFALRGDAEMKKELESGGELLAEGGRSMFQSLGVQLARMGCVAFVYDMLGYCDSRQISFQVAHKFAKQRPEMNARENWGLFSPQAEAHAQSILGLHAWNSIRALDFLTTLPDVDAKRLGCTGASGGGTQTMLLGALDPRLAVQCPAVMVSTAMQGGCVCENASLLRVGTGNVEFAALFAPKPIGMTAANDWTKEMETKGFPELQKHYALMGAPENVALWPMLQFGHNYNAPSRAKIYAWFNKHFALGLRDAQLVEREYTPLTREQLTVWDAEHSAPAGGDDFEKKLLRWWHDDAQAQMAKSPEDFEKIARPAWAAIIGRQPAPDGQFAPWRTVEMGGSSKNYSVLVSLLTLPGRRQQIPALQIQPPAWNGLSVLWLSERGKAGLFEESGDELRADVRKLLDAGARVIGIDLLFQGESLADGQPVAQTRRVKNTRESAAYTFGYNQALFAQRVQDIAATLEGLGAVGTRRAVAAVDSTGPLAAAALALVPGVESAVVNTAGFRFGHVLDLHDPMFLPAAAKYGDLPGVLKLARKRTPRLLILGEGEAAPDPIGWLLESQR